MKKLISILVILALICTMTVSFAAEDGAIQVTVDDALIEFDVPPTSENGRTLVPMRYIFEALGADVEWVQQESKAVAVKGDITVEIGVDKNVMLRNSKEITLDVPAKAIDGRILVPVRAVAEAFDAKVDWVAQENLVKIVSAEKMAEAEQENVVEYSWDTLSPKDTDAFVNSYDKIRYTFEQGYLLNTMLQSSKEVIMAIDGNEESLKDFVNNSWDYLMADVLLNMQLNSKDKYLVEIDENFTQDELINHYKKITEEHKVSSNDIFKCTYEKTPKKKKVLLLTFNDTTPRTTIEDSINLTIFSKYIVLIGSGETLRQFTLEQSPLDNTIYFLCEVEKDRRVNYGAVECTKEAVLKGIDEVLK